MFSRSALAAVVDLNDGSVIKLPEPVSLAYYDPGCGAGETATLTQEVGSKGQARSRLMTVDTTTGKIVSTVTAAGRVTSAVPAPQGIVGAAGNRLVAVGRKGALRTLTRTDDVPFRLAVARDGGIGFEVQSGDTVELHDFVRGKDEVVLKARARSVRLAGVAGRLYVRGDHAEGLADLPRGWRGVDVPVDAQLSTTGALAVDSAVNGHEARGGAAPGGGPARVLPVHVTETVTATGRTRVDQVAPHAPHPAWGSAPSPAVPKLQGTPHGATPKATTGDPSTETTDPDRACAIPRNDPEIESLQPTPQMAEWAADLAVKGALNVQRPAGYNGSGLPAYTPQGMFPSHALAGGGQVPAQVLLGVMAQESNMWQASPHAVDGESGNFEQGGFYGRAGVDTVDFAHADCGYGATQVTTGMRMGDTVYTHDQQVALTVDYAANIAAGLQILQDKWNQMHQLGVLANNGDPKYIENWWYALWAYNTGWHYRNDPSDPYSRPDVEGLGWSNNVRNDDYPADRNAFLANTTHCTDAEKDPSGNCVDAKHPNDWSYPERVIGFAEFSLTRYDYQTGTYHATFATGNWRLGPQIPALNTFCSLEGNQCDPNAPDGVNHCTRSDFTCYWHQPAVWITDYSTAGTERLTYQPGTQEPPKSDFYQSECTLNQLPANALVVDDQPDAHTRNGCSKNWTQHGDLKFSFAADDTGHFPSKIDFHQLDTGFNGHFWMAHAWHESGPSSIHEVTGTWTLDQKMNSWARVLVYVPDHGAMDPQASYTVHGSDSDSPTRSVVEGNYLDGNRKPAPGSWEPLGVFHFAGTTPRVSLSNMTQAWLNGDFPDGERDMAWDAVAFEPLPTKPANQVVVLGDSYTSGEGASNDPTDGHWDYYRSSDHDGSADFGDDPSFQDACHRSPYAWSRVAELPDDPYDTVASRLKDHDPTLAYHMSACSGAITDNLSANHAGQYDEGSQIDQGYLDQNTTLVMLSIGGNDARFGRVIQQCILHSTSQSCQDTTLDGDSAPLSTAEPQIIRNTVGPAVANTISEIHARAPNSQIMLMGYPRIIEDVNTCVAGIQADEAPWLRQMADVLNDRLAQSVTDERVAGVNVTFADPRDAFAGKGVCGDSSSGAPGQIRNLTIRVTRGENPQARLWGDIGLVSAQSFHPSIDGAATYGTVATATLKTMLTKRLLRRAKKTPN